jgi:phage shock protein C
MFCTQCGTALQESDRFCPQCGKAAGMPPGADTAAAPPRRVLRRILSRKKIAGVCAGFADYFEMDLTLMRIIFLATAILPPGVGGIAYVIAWIALPKDTTTR